MALVINEQELGERSQELKSNLAYYDAIGKPIVEEYSKDLDDKVASIRDYLNKIRQFNLDFDVLSLQKIVIDLSSTIYYTNENYEKLSLLEDMAKVKAKDKYNEAYLAKQDAATVDKRKYTSEQLRAIADQEAIEDELIHFIYTHAAAVLKSKIDSANELLKACSKSLSASIQSMQQFGVGQRHM